MSLQKEYALVNTDKICSPFIIKQVFMKIVPLAFNLDWHNGFEYVNLLKIQFMCEKTARIKILFFALYLLPYYNKVFTILEQTKQNAKAALIKLHCL